MTMEPNNITVEDVWAMLYETQKRQQETDRIVAESHAKTEKAVKDLVKVQAESKAENDREMKAFRDNINNILGRWDNSRGAVAEQYFFNSYKQGNRTFFGEQFDKIDKNLKGPKGEYDIVFFNCSSIGIIETKYKTRLDDVPDVCSNAEKFRMDFPYYANHKILLGLASLVFDEDTEDACRREGIAIIKQLGDTFVINDKHIKAF
jgi:soluble cytochrome b562